MWLDLIVNLSWLAIAQAPALAAATAAPQTTERQSAERPQGDEQRPEEQPVEEPPVAEQIEAALPWQTGTIALGAGLATLTLDQNYRYLDATAASTVLEQLWGNPPGDPTLGMIFPADKGPLAEEGWAVVLRSIDDGHVKDDDAATIKYDALLAEMKSGTAASNAERVKAGYETIELIGWAAKPHYDQAAHKLYWAKELKFGEAPETTLNYDVRALGRKGVLSMNAVAKMAQLAQVEAGMQQVLKMVAFNHGHRYEDFDDRVDTVAAYGIGGLIAGGIAAKVGLFKGLIAVLIAAKKAIIVGVLALVAFVAKVLKGRREKQQSAT